MSAKLVQYDPLETEDGGEVGVCVDESAWLWETIHEGPSLYPALVIYLAGWLATTGQSEVSRNILQINKTFLKTTPSLEKNS